MGIKRPSSKNVMISQKTLEFLASLLFHDNEFESAFVDLISWIKDQPAMIPENILERLITFLVRDPGNFSTELAHLNCVAMDNLAQMLPFDVYLDSFMARLRERAATKSFVEFREINASADESVQAMIESIRRTLKQDINLNWIVVPESMRNELAKLFKFNQDVIVSYETMVESINSSTQLMDKMRQELSDKILENIQLRKDLTYCQQQVSFLENPQAARPQTPP